VTRSVYKRDTDTTTSEKCLTRFQWNFGLIDLGRSCQSLEGDKSCKFCHKKQPFVSHEEPASENS